MFAHTVLSVQMQSGLVLPRPHGASQTKLSLQIRPEQQVPCPVPVQEAVSTRQVATHAPAPLQVVPVPQVVEQLPVDGLHVRQLFGLQVGVPPEQVPPWHVSPVVQRPRSHGVPFVACGLEQTPVFGSQVPATRH